MHSSWALRQFHLKYNKLLGGTVQYCKKSTVFATVDKVPICFQKPGVKFYNTVFPPQRGFRYNFAFMLNGV
jgi:hypothetical protein